MSEDTNPYSNDYYASFQDASLRSARVVVPLVLELFRPESVVDVGCGQGYWLSAFCDAGITDVWGFDGDYVDREKLRIPKDRFQAAELATPPHVDRTFEMAVSVEVAEHLPPSASERFADFMCSLAPVLLFSAAIPGQHGTAHTNPRWHHYWKDAYASRGYVALDPIRHQVWHDERVAIYYRQNIHLYVRTDWLERDQRAAKLRAAPRANCLTLIDEDALRLNIGLRYSLGRLPGLLARRLGLS